MQDRMRGRVVIDLDIPYTTTEDRVAEAVREGLRQELSTMVAASAVIKVKLVESGKEAEHE